MDYRKPIAVRLVTSNHLASNFQKPMAFDELTGFFITSNVEICTISRNIPAFCKKCQTAITNWVMVIACICQKIKHNRPHVDERIH